MPKKRAPKSAGSSEGVKAGLDTVAKIGITEGAGVGRPSIKSQEVCGRICEHLTEGKSLREIVKMEGMPGMSTVLRWLQDDLEFRGQYTCARERQAEIIADELIAISDDGSNDTYQDENGNTRTDTDVIARSKLRVDTRKWLLSKLLPKKYGDKIGVEHSGEVNGTVTVLTEERRKQLAEKKRNATLRRVANLAPGAN